PERIRKPEDLSGKVVATQTGTKYVDALEALDKKLEAAGKDGLNIQTYPKATDATAALLVGRVAAVLTQDTEAAFRMTQQKGKFAIAYLYPEFDTFGVYFRRGDRAVGPALRAAFAKLKANGTLKRIAVKHNLPLKSFGLK
ncbi:MAG: transporter substrate-binding domain-containing protein, partial [Actinomycetota bacterium]|nr:transporter substrate-binding domain-containing protein [Actinomycetota bacterium]